MQNIRLFALSTLSTLAITVATSNADAAGFYIQEQSISGLGSAFAGQVATPRDSSIVYFNPAGMTKLKGAQSSFGVNIIIPSSKLTNDGSVIPFGGATGGSGGNPYDATPVPAGSMSYEAIDNILWFGISVGAPFGLANDYEDGWFGRFDSTKSELETIDIQPSFAYKVSDTLSIGGGLNFQYVDAELGSVINQGAGERNSTLKGDDFSFGYNAGVLYEPIEGTVFGAHYRSGVHHDLEGSVIIDNNGSVQSATDATAELDLPEIIQLGLNQKINDRLSLQASATWFGWNSFEEIRVLSSSGTLISNTTQNYQTTWAFAVGGEYQLNDEWKLRAGYQYDQTPTTDEYRTSRTPDGDRQWIAAGATYTINDKFSLDLAATYIDISSESINVSRNSGLATFRANSEGRVGIVAAGLNYKF